MLSTPISESGITGVACGLALCGDTAIVEIMFGDFVALAFDQIINFLTKSVTMYGEHTPMRVVIRCPIGGGRGYGPTHSQSLLKHFIGIPTSRSSSCRHSTTAWASSRRCWRWANRACSSRTR